MEITRQTDTAPVLRELPSRLLAQTAMLVSRVVGEALAEAGSSRNQFAVLATLDSFGPSSQAELCRRTDLDRSDMNAVAVELEKVGAISRLVDPANRRQNLVTLTHLGGELYLDVSSRLSVAQAKALNSLSARDRTELLRLLNIVRDDLSPDR